MDEIKRRNTFLAESRRLKRRHVYLFLRVRESGIFKSQIQLTV